MSRLPGERIGAERPRPRARALSAAALLVTALLAASPADANVSLKNGNFFLGYTDVLYPGGFELKLERVYNSKTAFKGIFGWGWGAEYEVYLVHNGDRTITSHEYGGGAENVFVPSGAAGADVEGETQAILAAKKNDASLSAVDLARLPGRLRGDATYRHDQWASLAAAGKVTAPVMATGTVLVSDRFSHQTITKTQSGYRRDFDNGRTELFDERGKLTRVEDKNHNYIELSHDERGRLVGIVDNAGHPIRLSYGPDGLVRSLTCDRNRKATYEYDRLGDLVKSKDVDGNVYTYGYDRRHNMVRVGYADKTTMEVTYYAKSDGESVRSVKDRDGTKTVYDYRADGTRGEHSAVGVEVTDRAGELLTLSRYDYFLAYDANGREWTEKMITVLDDDRTETHYNACCGLPTKIDHNGEATLFEYDDKGHVTRKETPTEITVLEYDAAVSKVKHVERWAKGAPTEKTWSSFAYDAAGNLVLAENSEKKRVQLTYDPNGRIDSMIDAAGARTSFVYNRNSKPVEISVEGVGTIVVTYTEAGEIKKVDSPSGRAVALKITSSFQELLDIIRPAGVSLSF